MNTFILNGKTYTNISDEEVSQLVVDNKITQIEADTVFAQTALKASKKIGAEYNNTGVIVPFTSKDAVAVLQVKAAFELGENSTNIKLSNGQVLPMTANNFTAFAVWFAQKRNAFFQ